MINSEEYQEPNWGHTTLMEVMFMKNIISPEKGLTTEQMVDVLDGDELSSKLILQHLVTEGFFKKTGNVYYLSELGVRHAKKRILTFDESLKKWKEGKVDDFQIKLILNTRLNFMERIDALNKKNENISTNITKEDQQEVPIRDEIEFLKKRIAGLEKKFERLKEI
jgi:hypothetical protein